MKTKLVFLLLMLAAWSFSDITAANVLQNIIFPLIFSVCCLIILVKIFAKLGAFEGRGSGSAGGFFADIGGGDCGGGDGSC